MAPEYKAKIEPESKEEKARIEGVETLDIGMDGDIRGGIEG